MNLQQIEHEMKEQFERSGLLPFLVEDATQLLDMDGQLFAEIVLSDGEKLGEANVLINRLFPDGDVILRSKWAIEHLGDPAPAYGVNGSLKAAVLIQVALKSGSARTVVTVAVTKLAEIEFERILGRKVDLQKVARVVIEGALRRGGRSFWDPITDSYLEVSSSTVANISRLLKQTA